MRIDILDKLRGSAFILMFIFHIFVAINLFTNKYYNLDSSIIKYIGIIARYLFLLLLGISLYLSYKNSKNEDDYKKKQMKRSIQLLSIGIYVTIITYLVIPDKYIVFGILHFMAIIILILFNFVNNIPLLLIIFISIEFIKNIQLDYINDGSFKSFIKGIFGFSFYKNTIDHFYILKWINLVIIGILIGHIINYINNFNKLHDKNKKPIIKKSNNNCLLTKIGKNTLILYIIHLPILYIITTSFFK